MKINKLVLIHLFLTHWINVSQAQDIHFSQFYLNPLQQNPAMAGAIYGVEASMIYRDQWRVSGFSPYKTMSASFDMRFEQKRNQNGYLAGGFNFFSDKSGDSKLGVTQANISLAYLVRLNKFNRLGGGIQLGQFQRSLNYNNLQWGQQYNGNNFDSNLNNGESISGTNSISKFDVGLGLSWIYNDSGGDIKVTDNHDLNFSAGIGIFHLTRPTLSNDNDRLPIRFVCHFNGVVGIQSTKMAILPGFMYYKQGKQQNIYIGSLFRYLINQDSKYTGLKQYSALYFGVYSRLKDAITLKLAYDFSGFGFGLSYDINTSDFMSTAYSRNGFEISLKYIGFNPFIKTYGANHSRY